MVIPTEDSVITEMTSTLRDWGTMWKQLYVVGRCPVAQCLGLENCFKECLNEGKRWLTPEHLL